MILNTLPPRSVLVEVKTFSPGNKCPLIGVSARYDNLDKVLENKIVYPYIFVKLGDNITDAEFYILNPRDLRRITREGYLKWLKNGRHRRSVEELKKKRQPLCIHINDLIKYRNKWENIWSKQHTKPYPDTMTLE